MGFSKTAQEMAKEFVASLPPRFQTLNQEVENQLRLYLQAWFSKMSLVNREEFDIQAQVLAKTRAKLESMEQTLVHLEEKLRVQKAD